MALAQADLQIGKARTIIEEVLLKKLAQKEFPTLGDEVAKEFANRALPLASVDASVPLTAELMKKAESFMTTLIQPQKHIVFTVVLTMELQKLKMRKPHFTN